jgi:hypothetical protein
MSSAPKPIHLRVAFQANTPPIAWGRPDSPRRSLCAICHGPLPDVPLMMWRDDGAGASFCDPCVGKWISTKVVPV